MPFKVQYEIYDTQHKAPIISTTNRTMASIEWHDLLHKGGDIYRMEQTPMADGALTKPEQYLMLVYRVRKLWRKYFDGGRKQEVLLASIEEEKKLDEWNARTRKYIDSHSDVVNGKDKERFGFFLVVEGWRAAWKDRKQYSRRKDCDEAVLKEISKKCRDFEKQIDSYIKNKLQLI